MGTICFCFILGGFQERSELINVNLDQSQKLQSNLWSKREEKERKHSHLQGITTHLTKRIPLRRHLKNL